MIVAQRRLDVAAAKAHTSPSALRARITTSPNDFVATLRARATPVALLAEMKRASPSKGDIAKGVDAAQQALSYALAGAATISVLTEPNWFKGSLTDLERVRRALEEGGLSPGVCVLRKDFIIDEYQLLEARAYGADTALLIVASLPIDELKMLMAASRGLGMEPLVEVANEPEMRIALEAGARVIGINNRNLHTFEVDMSTTGRCAALVPKESDVILLALSGVADHADVTAFLEVGAKGVLVGESLMRAPSPAVLARELLALPPPATMCKVCGVRDAEAAITAAMEGADFIGLIFAPSKRQVSVDEATKIVRAVREAKPRLTDWSLPRFPQRTAPTEAKDEARETRLWLEGWSALLRRASAQGGPLIVGVFVDASIEEMNATAEAVGLDLIQLHGQSEGWEVASKLVRPAVRVVHMDSQLNADEVCAEMRGGPPVAILLDSKGGGTGKTFDWAIGAEVQQRTPFILAGGLTPDNVAAAVQQVRPWCVDVSSGVETDGQKDHAKIRAYIRNAKAA